MLLPEPAPDFHDPLGLLAACHGRIESQCATLLRLPAYLDLHGCDAQARQAALKALRYFESAGRHHHADEERDLFPLLRVHAAHSQEETLPAVLDCLEVQHGEMEGAWQALAIPLSGLANGRLAPGLLPLVEDFARLYRDHMVVENAVILPFARKCLGIAELRSLGERMAARRGVMPT